MPNDNTPAGAAQPVQITFFDGDQTNCFPDCHMRPTWEQIVTMYRGANSVGRGKSKGSRGYAVFAQLDAGTEESCAAIQAARRNAQPRDERPWTMSDAQRQVVMTEGYRNTAHMLAATVIVIDYDGDPAAEPNWTPEAWPCELLAHSTHSWTKETPGCWRVLLRLDVPIPIAQYNDVAAALRKILPKHTNLRNGVQPAFLPTCPSEQEVQFVGLNEGDPLDWQLLLAHQPPEPERPAAALPVPELAANEMPTLAERAVVVQALAAVWPASGGGQCYATALALGGVLGGTGWPENDCYDFCEALYEAAAWSNVPKCVSWSMSSVTKRRDGDSHVFGWPKLKECVGAVPALQALQDLIDPPLPQLTMPIPGAPTAVVLGVIEGEDQVIRRALTTGDNEDIARMLCREQLTGSVFDEGRMWLQGENGVWDEVTESQIARWTALFSGAEYDHRVTERGTSTHKKIAISASKCKDVYQLCCHGRDCQGFFAAGPVGVGFENGFLDVGTGVLGELSDSRSRRVLPFDYDPGVLEHTAPSQWLAFVSSIWGEDVESIQCLHEILGYLLSGRLDLQKMFVFLGPARAGKGLVLHLLRHLLGKECGSFKIAALDQPFALASFLGRSVMCDPDVRKSRGIKVNTGVIAERLLSTVAADEQVISAKYERDLMAVLPTRVVMAANPPFGLLDEGGALSKRMIILPFPTSFFGREDIGMLARILQDLPGIVALSLEALKELTARGRFQEPKAAQADRKAAQYMEIPALGFFDDMCELSPDYEVPKEQLYECYKQWCERNGGRPAHMNMFAAVAKQVGCGLRRHRVDGARVRSFTGVRIEKPVALSVVG